MNDALTVKGLRVAYGRHIAVHGVDLSIANAAIGAILGPNGAGKTSLIRGISGFERFEQGRVAAGEVTFEGTSIEGWSPSRVFNLGLCLVPERRSVFLPLSVAENLRLAGRRSRGSEMEELVHDLFPVLARRAHQPAGLLSGGERQMLGIAMRLLTSPRLLVLDEVSLGLAPATVRAIFAALARVRAKTAMTILMVEQNVPAALSIADHVWVMHAGEIVSSGAAEDFRSRPNLFHRFIERRDRS